MAKQRLSVERFIATGKSSGGVGTEIEFSEFLTGTGVGGGKWRKTGVTGFTPVSQTPAEYYDFTGKAGYFVDSIGDEWKIEVPEDGLLITKLGAPCNGTDDDTDAVNIALKCSDLVLFYNRVNLSSIVIQDDYKAINGMNSLFKAGEIEIQGAGVEITKCRFDYTWVNSGANVIYINGAEDAEIHNNLFRRLSNQYPIRLNGCSADIHNNKIKNTTYGIENVNGSNGGTKCTYISITNNRLDTIAGSGINLVNGAETFGTPEHTALWEEANTFFDDVILANNKLTNITGYSIVYRSWYCNCSGNIIRTSKTPTFQGGEVVFINNHLHNIVAAGVDFGNVTRGIIVGNVINQSEYACIEINACNKVTVANNSTRDSCTLANAGLVSAHIWVHGVGGTTVPNRASTEILVIGNVCSLGASGQALYGVSVEDTDSTVLLLGNQLQNSGSLKEVVSESAKVMGFANVNNFGYDNYRLYNFGTITDGGTYPLS